MSEDTETTESTDGEPTDTLTFTVSIIFTKPVPLQHSATVHELLHDALNDWIESGPGFYYPRDDANMDNETDMDGWATDDSAFTFQTIIEPTTPGAPSTFSRVFHQPIITLAF